MVCSESKDNNTRISQLALMMAHVLHEEYCDSYHRIINTHVGKMILKNEKKYIFEQHTANLYEIFLELFSIEDLDKMSILEKITLSTEMINNNSFINTDADKTSFVIKRIGINDKKIYRNMRKIQRLNLLNSLRIERSILNENYFSSKGQKHVRNKLIRSKKKKCLKQKSSQYNKSLITRREDNAIEFKK